MRARVYEFPLPLTLFHWPNTAFLFARIGPEITNMSGRVYMEMPWNSL